MQGSAKSDLQPKSSALNADALSGLQMNQRSGLHLWTDLYGK